MNDSHANSSPVSRQGLLQKLRDARVSLPRAQRQLCNVLYWDPAKSH